MWDKMMQKQCLDGDRIFVIRDFLTPEESAAFVARSEQKGYRTQRGSRRPRARS